MLMKTTKFLAFIACAAILSACGSDEGSGDRPKLVNEGLFAPISPFDTVSVKFNSSLVENDESIIIAASGELVGKSTGKELRFIGKNTTPRGTHYFDPGFNSIVFKKLKNSDGYRMVDKDSLTFYFSTYPILDNLDGENDTLKTAVNLDFSSSPTIQFAGVLDHKLAASRYNTVDYYKMSMRMNDTLRISAKANDSLTIVITEPDKNSVKQTYGLKAKKETRFPDLVIGGGHINVGAGEPSDKPADFYIRVYDERAEAPPNPYTLSISRLRPK